jgi:CheY-like chemotaxis protein
VEEPRRLVLVVEDFAEAYELLSDYLASEGFQVVGAENGIDAIDTAVRLVPDLIVMDLSLPRLGGLEAAALLKQDERTWFIPIVALTAHEELAARARDAGCDAFFTKPFAAPQLLTRLRDLLGRAKAGALAH